MLRFKRPRPPASYAAKARAGERIMRADITAGNDPTFDDRIWKAYKDVFIAAQHGKCGYCEQPSLNHPGVVEHYAPKSEVHELASPGIEHNASASVLDRRTFPISRRGYWWLAYAWATGYSYANDVTRDGSGVCFRCASNTERFRPTAPRRRRRCC